MTVLEYRFMERVPILLHDLLAEISSLRKQIGGTPSDENAPVSFGDVSHMSTIPYNRPMFINDIFGPVRISGLLVVYGKKFEYNGEPFATFPVREDGIIDFGHDCNNGTCGVYPGPVAKDGHLYREGLDAFLSENRGATEEDFLERCREIGLEVRDNPSAGSADDDEVFEAALRDAVEKMGNWLKPYGYTLVCDEVDLGEDLVGEYGAGSVFTYEIHIRISREEIKKACRDGRLTEGLSAETHLSVYHEVGHALVEQLLDWAANLDVLRDALKGTFGEQYHDVFVDNDTDEEILVEDFARSIHYGYSSLLERCWVETTKMIAE